MSHPSPRTALAVLLVAPLLGALPVRPAAAADPVVWHTDYPTARKAADLKKLPLLVVIGTDQCVYCRKLEATFADPKTRDFVAGRFVCLKVDANKEVEFARAMRVTVYPTTVIAGPDGRVYAYLAGYQTPEQFGDHAAKALVLLPPADRGSDQPTKSTSMSLTKAAPVRAVGPADGPRPLLPAADLLAAARAAYKADRFADCLGLCDQLAAGHPGTSEAEAAAGIRAAVRADVNKLAAAGDQLDDKVAAGYYDLAEAWATQGRVRYAAACYEKAIRAAPAGRHAGPAQEKLDVLYRDHPTLRAAK